MDWTVTADGYFTSSNGSSGYNAIVGVGISGNATDSSAIAPMSLTAFRFRIYCQVYASGITAVFQKNGANGNQTVTTTGAGWFQDTTNTDSLSAGDLFCYRHNGTGMHGDNDSTGDAQCLLSGSGQRPMLSKRTNSSFAYMGVSGTSGPNPTTESYYQKYVRVAVTLQSLYIQCTGFSTTQTVALRKNAADTSVSVSVTGIGQFADTTNTASMAVGDLVTIGAGGTANFWTAGTVTSSSLAGWLSAAINGTASYYVWGSYSPNATESRVQVETGAFTGRYFGGNCWTYTSSGSIRVRKNGANGNQSVTISATGHYADATNSDTFAALDLATGQGVSGTFSVYASMEWGYVAPAELLFEPVVIGQAVQRAATF